MSVAIAPRQKITIKIGSKPVKPLSGQYKLRHDLGKYRRNLAGREIEVTDDTVSVWCFRSQDSDGTYYGLMGCYRAS